jgi:uncharacterized glyoxalase superfamily protein PhnB
MVAIDAMVSSTGSGFKAFTLSHNVASEAEAEKIIEKAVTAGATLSKAAQKTFWGGYSGYFSKTQTATYGKLLTIPFSG